MSTASTTSSTIANSLLKSISSLVLHLDVKEGLSLTTMYRMYEDVERLIHSHRWEVKTRALLDEACQLVDPDEADKLTPVQGVKLLSLLSSALSLLLHEDEPSQVPALPTEVLSHIIDFATEGNMREQQQQRFTLARVNREFYRIVRPHLRSTLHVATSRQLAGLAKLVKEDAQRFEDVRVLKLKLDIQALEYKPPATWYGLHLPMIIAACSKVDIVHLNLRYGYERFHDGFLETFDIDTSLANAVGDHTFRLAKAFAGAREVHIDYGADSRLRERAEDLITGYDSCRELYIHWSKSGAGLSEFTPYVARPDAFDEDDTYHGPYKTLSIPNTPLRIPSLARLLASSISAATLRRLDITVIISGMANSSASREATNAIDSLAVALPPTLTNLSLRVRNKLRNLFEQVTISLAETLLALPSLKTLKIGGTKLDASLPQLLTASKVTHLTLLPLCTNINRTNNPSETHEAWLGASTDFVNLRSLKLCQAPEVRFVSRGLAETCKARGIKLTTVAVPSGWSAHA